QRRQLLLRQLGRPPGSEGSPGHVPDQQRRIIAARGEEPTIRRPRQAIYPPTMLLESAALMTRANVPQPHGLGRPDRAEEGRHDRGDTPTVRGKHEGREKFLWVKGHKRS